jgi:Rrf2 family protein
MRVSAKADYAIRAAVELAAAGDGPVKGDRIAKAQGIPSNFLENILADLRNAGIVSSRRGAEGGYWLARPADEVSLADVIRAVDGPLANVRGVRSDQRVVSYPTTFDSSPPTRTPGRRTRTIWPGSSSSSAACPLVIWTARRFPSSSMSSQRVEKPRCTIRSTCASRAPDSASKVISRSCGRTSSPSNRIASPTNVITKSFAGAS